MRKSDLFLAALAFFSVLSCQKEENQMLIPANREDPTVIIAYASNHETKTYVDGLQVKWSKGDVIAVADADDNPIEFTLTSGENTASATFGGDLGGSTLGTLAAYPSTTNVLFGSNELYVDYLDSWDYGKSEVPMYGVNNGSGVYSFNNIGGAIQVAYTNIPATTNHKHFVITETHTGGEAKYITGSAYVYNLNSTPAVDLSGLDGQAVTIDNIPKDATNVTLIIPAPAGTGYNFKVELFEHGATDPIEGSVKNASNRTITAGKILRFPTITIPTVLYLETFGSTTNTSAYGTYTGYSATSSMFTTSGDVKTHYSGDGSVGKNNYAAANLSNGYAGASGLSGCYQSGTKDTKKIIVRISNINIEDYQNLSLSFGALGGSTSHKVDVAYIIDSGAETSLISNGSITNAEWTLLSQSISGTGNSLTLIFSHTPSKNWLIRMDDIKVVGTPIP